MELDVEVNKRGSERKVGTNFHQLLDLQEWSKRNKFLQLSKTMIENRR